MRELRANAGSQFDPAVIEIFCSELRGGGAGVNPDRLDLLGVSPELERA
jgi:hypothetical protein